MLEVVIARLVLRGGAVLAALELGGDTVGTVLLVLLAAGAILTDAAERRELHQTLDTYRRWAAMIIAEREEGKS